jgi:hypothetical protein
MIEKGCNGKNAKLFFLRTKNGMKQHCDMKIKFCTNEGRMLLWATWSFGPGEVNNGTTFSQNTTPLHCKVLTV